MKAIDVLDHFREVGEWVDWTNTCDRFLHGEPEMEVRGIVTAWSPTNEAIRFAAERGANLFVTHEPAFYDDYRYTSTGVDAIARKKRILDDYGMVLLRCHDTWDRMPEHGIVDSWASYLGFPAEDRKVRSYYRKVHVGGVTVEDAARQILDRVRELGQENVTVLGRKEKRIETLAVGTGAITHLPSMYEMGVDAILATDDGMNFWDGGLWALDSDIPLIIVNHATSEKPGMIAMARYLNEKLCAECNIDYIDVAFPYVNIV